MLSKTRLGETETAERYGPILSLVRSSKEGDALVLDAPSASAGGIGRLPSPPEPKAFAAFSLVATFLSILVLRYVGSSWGWGLVVGACTMTSGVAYVMAYDRSSLLSVSVAVFGAAVLFGWAFAEHQDLVHREAPFIFAAIGTFFLCVVCYLVGGSGSGVRAREGEVVALYADRLEFVDTDSRVPKPASLRLDPTDEVRTIEKDGIRNVFLMARDGSIRFEMSDYVAMDRDLNVVSDDVAQEIRSRISRL